MVSSESNRSRIRRSRIVGTGHYVPKRVLTNHDLEKMVDTSDAWIVERTGIRERHIAAEGEASSDMAAEAAKRALERANLSARDLDLIIVATVTPDMPLPATAVFVQQKIGARPDCPAFDIAAACAGFIYGLSIADRFLVSGAARHVLVVGVELLSRVINWTDRTTCVLFGDGAGAALLPSTKRGAAPACSRRTFTPTARRPLRSTSPPAARARPPATPRSTRASTSCT
jgi:3-oxoacyl-[acyl-carrier-protein] synthase-3